MKVLRRIIVAIFFLAVFLLSCEYEDDKPCNCQEEIDKIVATYGPPEEINSYESKNYYNYDYWYWSKGFEYSFTSSSSSCCEVSKYTFPPIKKILVSDSIKLIIDKNKILIEHNSNVIDYEKPL